MAQGKTIPDTIVSGVVSDLYLGQMTWEQIGEKHGVSQGSIANIKDRYLEDFERVKKAVPEAEQITALATNLLTQSLVTLTIQLEQFGDKNWLKNQSAGELAVLFGVTSDKTIRLLAAAQHANEQRAAAGERTALADVAEE